MVANDQLVELDKGILFEIIIRVNICIYLSMCTLDLQIIPKSMLYVILAQPNRAKKARRIDILCM